MRISSNILYSQHVRNYVKAFVYIVSFIPINNAMKFKQLYLQFTYKDIRFSIFPKVTWLVRSVCIRVHWWIC